MLIVLMKNRSYEQFYEAVNNENRLAIRYFPYEIIENY
jgi:hypothetical protein